MEIILQIIFALIYQNLLEWVLHKYVLHELGKKKNNSFSFHWKIHHKKVRQNNYYDEDYLLPIYKKNPNSSEITSLFLLSLVHLPIAFCFFWFYLTLFCGALAYYYIHRKSHLNPEWGKKYFRWHYDHHMVGNQNHNWCVTFPLMDYLFKTRVKMSNVPKI